jgi:hypothetical protein
MPASFGQYNDYKSAIDAINADTSLTAEQKADLKKSLAESQYGPSADLGQFETLLGKLESSKMRQAGQAARETRRNVFAQGISNMMSNF